MTKISLLCSKIFEFLNFPKIFCYGWGLFGIFQPAQDQMGSFGALTTHLGPTMAEKRGE